MSNWVWNTPQQGWAHADGLIDLQPGATIKAADAADYLMIQETFSRWGIAFDEGRSAVIRSIFAADGVLEMREAREESRRTVVGVENIVNDVEAGRLEHGEQQRHAISNVVVERLERAQAVALAYGVVTAAKSSELIVGATAIYRGELARQSDGDWRFTKLLIGVDCIAREAE